MSINKKSFSKQNNRILIVMVIGSLLIFFTSLLSESIIVTQIIYLLNLSLLVLSSLYILKRFKAEDLAIENELSKLRKERMQGLKQLKNLKLRIGSMSKTEKELKSKVGEAEAMQKEMKEFADMQIETNEQLLIAETKLRNMLEKEQESKAIINQTLDKLKDTQGQLVHSEKMASLGQLTAGIAHEINNPINFVFNGIGSLQTSLKEISQLLDQYSELDQGADAETIIPTIRKLKKELEYDDLRADLDELLIDIKEGAVRTIEIVKGLRVFSRLDEEDRKDASINECLDATLVLLKNKTKNRINVVKSLDPELPRISCYPGQLNQVFMNIINNAIQAIPEDKRDAEIKVATEKTDNGVTIKLKDNGTGMSEEVKKRIFEPFFTTKPVGVGTGLGMSISYGIIEKHQGSLSVESELGKGTEFIITLPKQVAEEYSKAM